MRCIYSAEFTFFGFHCRYYFSLSLSVLLQTFIVGTTSAFHCRYYFSLSLSVLLQPFIVGTTSAFHYRYYFSLSLSVLLQPSYGVDTWFTEIMRTKSGVHKSWASVRVTKFFTVEFHIFVVLCLDLATCQSGV